MIEAALLTSILWFGILSLPAAESFRWVLTVFEVGLFAMAVVAILRRRLAIRPHPIAMLLAIAALWAVVQVWLGISVDPQRTMQAALGWTLNCTAFSVTLAICARGDVRKRFLRAQVIFAFALSVASVIGLYTVSKLGPFAYKNQFAAYVESVMGIAIAASFGTDRRRGAPGWPWILAAAAMFASVVASGSRAGSILCLAELIFLPVAAYLRGWISGPSLLRLASIAIAGGAVLVTITGWETTWRRLQDNNPYSLRADLLRSSAAMARDRPLSGFGLGAWSSAYPGYALYDDGRFVNQAHNDWAQWAVEGGIPFLILMLAVAALSVRPALASIWGIGLMAVFVHAWIDYPFEQRPALAAFLFAVAGALCAEPIVSPKADLPDEPSGA